MKISHKPLNVAWAVVLCYLLIAFEFFYMASPFAIYFYSVYNPGISFLNHFPSLAWLTGFFLPHLVEETRSGLLNVVTLTGLLLACAGFIMFLVCAIQVYYAKLFKRGAVTKGFYKYIRHPQYTAFSICSFGMLLVWPRFLTLLFFVSLLFVYYWLARKEERECAEKFGEAYKTYCNLTYRFFPVKFVHIPESWKKLRIPIIVVYIFSLSVSFGIAVLLKTYAIGQLYSYNDNAGQWISIYKLPESDFKKLSGFIFDNKHIDRLIKSKNLNRQEIINYVIPSEMYISEIPMIEPANSQCHVNGLEYNKNIVKVIVTQGIHKHKGKSYSGNKLLRKTLTLKPLAEVWIDLNKSKLLDVIDLPDKPRYMNIPEPIF